MLGAEAWPVCQEAPFLFLLLFHWCLQTSLSPSLQGPDLCLVGLAHVLCVRPGPHTQSSDSSVRGGHVGLHSAQALVLQGQEWLPQRKAFCSQFQVQCQCQLNI